MTRALIPYDAREVLALKAPASIAARSESTMRLWCEQHGIGRRIVGGHWSVSRVALQMLLEGDAPALAAYLAGDRQSTGVVTYFERVGLGDLITEWDLLAKSPIVAEPAKSPIFTESAKAAVLM